MWVGLPSLQQLDRSPHLWRLQMRAQPPTLMSAMRQVTPVKGVQYATSIVACLGRCEPAHHTAAPGKCHQHRCMPGSVRAGHITRRHQANATSSVACLGRCEPATSHGGTRQMPPAAWHAWVGASRPHHTAALGKCHQHRGVPGSRMLGKECKH